MANRISGRFVRVTVRPQATTVAGDVFGDASPITADVRGDSITGVRMQVSIIAGAKKSGSPGRDIDQRAVAILRRSDVPAASDWTPTVNDIVQLPDGTSYFIADIQGAFPRRPSFNHPDGGFAGWRLVLTDKSPMISAATTYER
jgi:hypothetical protein